MNSESFCFFTAQPASRAPFANSCAMRSELLFRHRLVVITNTFFILLSSLYSPKPPCKIIITEAA